MIITFRPVRAKEMNINLLPLQGENTKERTSLFPGCYPGLYDKSLSGLEIV